MSDDSDFLIDNFITVAYGAMTNKATADGVFEVGQRWFDIDYSGCQQHFFCAPFYVPGLY